MCLQISLYQQLYLKIIQKLANLQVNSLMSNDTKLDMTDVHTSNYIKQVFDWQKTVIIQFRHSLRSFHA